MHQPLIPAGGSDLRTAAIISNLKHMMDHQGTGDNHNAPVFVRCYKRMGEFIPQLMDEGKEPRVMLEYSGTLLHGMRQMGLHEVFDALRRVTCDPKYRRGVEWLGCPWGHAVAPSTPVQDYRLHVKAWQHHFAGIFGIEALRRVRVSLLRDGVAQSSRRRLRLRQDATRLRLHLGAGAGTHGENPANGHGPEKKHLPHRLVCTSSAGEEAEIIALIKTQGSDTKLVGQMQPYYEAKSLSLGAGRQERAAAGHSDRRRRERRRNDERVPAQVRRVRPRGIRFGDAIDERHRVP